MKNIVEIKNNYPEGTEVMCLVMSDKHPVPSGTIGKVTHVDDAGQIHVNWNNGSTLALIPEVDTFAIVED